MLGVDRTGLHRGALLARWAGVLLGLLVMAALVVVGASGIPASGPLAFGVPAALGPAVGGRVLVLAIAGGELTLPAPRTSVRRASLHRRTPGDLVPRPALWLCAITGGVLVLALGAALALRVILRRRPSDDALDILLRRRSSTSVLGALVLAVAGTLLPVSALLVMRLLPSAGHTATGLEQGSIAVGALGVVVGLLALPAGLVMVVFPGTMARRSAQRGGVGRDVGTAETVREVGR